MGRTTPVSGHPSRPASRNAFDENAETLVSAEAESAHLRRELKSADILRSSASGQGSTTVQNMGPPTSFTYAAVLGTSLSRSTTPDPQLIARAPSPCPTPIGGGRNAISEKRGINGSRSFNNVVSNTNESEDLVAALSRMDLSTNGVIDEESHLPVQIEQDVENHQSYLFNLQGGQSNIKQHSYLKKSESARLQMPSAPQSGKASYSDSVKNNGVGSELNNSLMADRQAELHKPSVPSSNSYLKGSSTSSHNGGGSLPSHYQHFVDNTNSSMANYGLGAYSVNPAVASMMASHLGSANLSPVFENVAAASAMGVPGIDSRILGAGLASGPNIGAAAPESQNLNRIGNHIAGNALQAPFLDPMYLQYLRTAEYAAAQVAAINDPSVDRNYLGNSYVDLLGLQKAYLGALLSPQKSQYGVPLGSKSSGSNHHGYYGNPAFGIGMSYPGSPLASPVIPNSPIGQGSPIRHNDLNMRFASGMRNMSGGVMAPWHLDPGCNMDESFASSLLEEFKSNKTKCFELSEIAGHVVEFRYMLLIVDILAHNYSNASCS